MLTQVLLGAAISGIIGFVLAIPAIFLESMRRVKDLPLLIDVKIILGKKLTDGEMFLTSLLLHIIIATLAGGVYVFLAENNGLFVTHTPYVLYSILVFSVFAWAAAGLVVYPLLGMGVFAKKEGEHMWFEMLVTHLLIGFGFWMGVVYYQPFFFG